MLMFCASLYNKTKGTKNDVSKITGRRLKIKPGNCEDMLRRLGRCVCVCMSGDSLCGTRNANLKFSQNIYAGKNQ